MIGEWFADFCLVARTTVKILVAWLVASIALGLLAGHFMRAGSGPDRKEDDE